MNRRVIPLLGLLACGGDDPGSTEAEAPFNTDTPAPVEATTTSRAALVRALDFVGAVDGVTEGFDLDGVVSDGDDVAGCGQVDAVDPEGRPGIDNAFATMIPLIESTEAQALGDLVNNSILNGELLLLLELTEPVDPDAPDACADVTIWRGVGQPLLGADGSLLDGQTLKAVEPDVAMCVPFVDGVVEARGFDVELPMQVLDVELVFHLEDVALRAELHPDGTWTGILGAGLPLTDIEVILAEDDIADLAGILRPVVEGLQDLWPDADGVCRSMSATLAFEALPVFLATEASE